MGDLIPVIDGELLPDDEPATRQLVPAGAGNPLRILRRDPTTTNPADAYLAKLQSANSRATMAKQLDAIAQLLGHDSRATVAWGQLRYEHTTALRSKIRETSAATSTANLRLSALRGVLQAARKLRQIGLEDYENAVEDLDNFKGEQIDAAAGRSLTRRELIALFDICADDASPAGARDAAILALGYAAGGLRRAEIVALDLDSYEPTTNMLIIKGKGNKKRTAYVRGGALRALDDWLAARGLTAGPLFSRLQQGGPAGAADGRLTPQSIYDMYKARAREAGVADFSPHDVRRSFISDQLAAGTDALTVSKLAGHSDPKTTLRYDRRGEIAKQEAADALHVPYRGRRHDNSS